MNIKIRKEYKEILHMIEDVCINFDTTKSDNLMKIIKMTKLKDKFNIIDFCDNFEPNESKPYSILNTDHENDKGNGTHWVVYFKMIISCTSMTRSDVKIL